MLLTSGIKPDMEAVRKFTQRSIHHVLVIFRRCYIGINKLPKDATGVTTCHVCTQVFGASMDMEDYR